MTPADAGSSEAAAPRGTVLLVEEQQNVRTLLGKYLADQGYVTLEARNSEEALKQCRTHKSPPISLMICDLVMSEMNGVELAGRARSFHPRMKTLYLSSHSESSVIYRGIPLTDIQFLPKPFKLKELISTVNELLGHAK
jgi:DNA-binding NtrC family response regulator